MDGSDNKPRIGVENSGLNLWSKELSKDFVMMDEAVLNPGNNGSETGMRATELAWCRLEIRIASTRKPGTG